MTLVPDANPSWTSLEHLLARVDQLAKGADDLDRFHAQLLEDLVEGLSMRGGVVWVERPDGRLEAGCQIQPETVQLSTHGDVRRLHSAVVETLFRQPQSRTIPARGHDGNLRNPTDFQLYFQPLTGGGQVVAVLELFQPTEEDSHVAQGVMRLLAAVNEIAGECYLRRRLKDLEQENRLAKQLERYLDRIFRPESQRGFAYVATNETRQLLRADRVTLCERRGERCRVLAVSGVDRVERRAESVRAAESLARTLLTSGPLWYPADSETLAPQLEAVLDAYVESTAVTGLAVVPLASRDVEDEETRGDDAREILPSPYGVLLVDWFRDVPQPTDRTRVAAIVPFLALALYRAQLQDRLPLLTVTRPLRDIGWQRGLLSWRKLLAVLAGICALLLLLFLIPAELTVTATGRIQPRERADIFAPRNSVVLQLPVEHGQGVRRGDVLAELRSPDLERLMNETQGRLRTVEETLAAVRATRLQQGRTSADAGESGQLSAQEVELDVTWKGLQQQWQLLIDQQEELTMTSPFDGQVVTWDVRQLMARPVTHGEFLMRVARLDGPWMLELEVSEGRVGHVLQAYASLRGAERLRVEYLLETSPGRSYHGEVAGIADSTHVNAQGLPVVLVEADLPSTDFPAQRPGATVHARIACGRRSLGYVWFHRLYEAIRMAIAYRF